MEETGLRDVFSVVVTANDVTELKPSPEGLIRAMELAHANPDKALYLGDAVKDMEAARRAGIKSAAALWGFGDSQLLRAQHPDFAFKDPIDALNQLTN